MRYEIYLYGWDREYVLGSVPKETWDYIQEKFDGDADSYWEAIDNEEVPDEFILGGGDIFECNDIYHDCEFYLNQAHISVTDENNVEVYKCDLEDLRNLPIKRTRNVKFIGKNVPYISSCVYGGKGGTPYFVECDEFDPEKLEVMYTVIFWDVGDSDNEKDKEFFDGPVVTGIFYDGKEIDWSDGGDEGKYGEKEFIDRSMYVEEN